MPIKALDALLIAMLLTAHGDIPGWNESLLADDPQNQSLILHNADNETGRAAYTFDRSAYRGELKHLPIGVFDSGIGGLTVLEAILSLDAFDNETLRAGADGRPDFQNERFIYLGDQANMPYGNYAAVGKEDFLRELILKDAIFLLGRRYWNSVAATTPAFDKPPVKAIVIACNTATAYGLQDIRAAIRAWEIPVIVVGVVEAGARGVNDSITSTDKRHTVAVMATLGTCSSMAYPRAIGGATGLAGKRVPNVIQQGSIGLAGAIEGDPAFIRTIVESPESAASESSVSYLGPSPENQASPLDVNRLDLYDFEMPGVIGTPAEPATFRLNSVPNYVRYDVTTLVENYRQSGGTEPIDTIVLGCTHFPLVQEEIVAAFQRLRDFDPDGDGSQPFRKLIAQKLSVINPAELTAKELFRALASAGLRLNGNQQSIAAEDTFFISVPVPDCPGVRLTQDGGLDRDYKYGRQIGQLSVEDTRYIPLQLNLLPQSSLQLIQSRLPEVWRRLR